MTLVSGSGATIKSKVDGTFTTGQQPPSRLEFSTGPANTAVSKAFQIDSNHIISIGPGDYTSSFARLYISSDDTNVGVIASGANATSPGSFTCRRARGSHASLADINLGDTIGAFVSQAYSGGTWFQTASIVAKSQDAFTTGQRPSSQLVFRTNASNGAVTDYMALTANGTLYVANPAGLGTLTPTGAGTINVQNNIYLAGAQYANPDYVLEHFYTGKIEVFKDNFNANKYSGLISLKEIETFISSRFYLPQLDFFGIHDGMAGIKERHDVSLLLHEEEFIHLIEHEKRINTLQKMVIQKNSKILELEQRLERLENLLLK